MPYLCKCGHAHNVSIHRYCVDTECDCDEYREVRRVGPLEQLKTVSDRVESQARNDQTLERLVASDNANGPTVRTDTAVLPEQRRLTEKEQKALRKVYDKIYKPVETAVLSEEQVLDLWALHDRMRCKHIDEGNSLAEYSVDCKKCPLERILGSRHALLAKPAQGSEPSDYFRGQRETVKYLLTLKPKQLHQALLDMQTGMDATLKAPQK